MTRMQSLRRLGAQLQRAVPVRTIDIDRPHLDAVLLRIAHDLRRRVETHGLAVEEGCCKSVGITAFDPGGGVDEDREACRMAFGKAVFAETLDLTEAAFRKLALVVARDHPLDELVAKAIDRAHALERRHRAPQLVRLLRREAGGDDS